MKMFHRELGFPLTFKYPDTVIDLEWSRHAREEASEDRYGAIDILKKLDTTQFEPIEIEMRDSLKHTVKILLRSKYEVEGNNIVIAVMPESEKTWFVKTVWYNQVSDEHETLDESVYNVPAFKHPKYTEFLTKEDVVLTEE